ncbi:hypothetical protein ACJW30_08G068300 [Castanea mollissima]
MANHHNTIFSLDRKDFVLVLPAKPTSSCVLSLSSIDNNPNLQLLSHTVYVQADPANVIREALSKALVYYYPLAGKLKKNCAGKLQINCTGDGVPFLVATSNCDLSSLHYLDGVDAEVTKQFVYDIPFEGDSGYHPLVFQLTKFSCGGFTIGMSLSHSLCDGFGAAQFFRALAELASGKSEPSVKPVWERERLVGTPTEEPFQLHVDKTSLAASPYLPTTDLLHECFYVSGDSINRLKMSLTEECGSENLNESFTTIEALSAYNSDGKILFWFIVGIRKLLNPPLPDGYYGNAFTEANVELMGGEQNEKKVASKSDYIMHSLGVLERCREENIKFNGGGASMVLTDWRQLGLLEEVDFGWKGSINIIPVPMNMFGYVDLCMFLPPSNVDPSMKDGVRAFVSLPRAAMEEFKKRYVRECGDKPCLER